MRPFGLLRPVLLKYSACALLPTSGAKSSLEWFMMRSIAFAVLTLVFAGSAVEAAGTKQEDEACARDAKRFCRQLIVQGDMAVLGCLQQNRVRLKPICRQVLTNHGV